MRGENGVWVSRGASISTDAPSAFDPDPPHVPIVPPPLPHHSPLLNTCGEVGTPKKTALELHPHPHGLGGELHGEACLDTVADLAGKCHEVGGGGLATVGERQGVLGG